jgi:hypothetical protein
MVCVDLQFKPTKNCMQILLIWFLYLPFTGLSPEAKENRFSPAEDSTFVLYESCKLRDVISFSVFQKTMEGIKTYKPQKPIVTIIDFTLPSSKKRFFVIDLQAKKMLLSTWVAHGKKSGVEMALSFSNKLNSNQSSPGFYKVGQPLQSPKHGLALELFGLEKGINHNAQKREIIIHGAKYVSEDFIKQYGRCGRSFGCPALPIEVIPKAVQLLSNGSLLYIHVSKNADKKAQNVDKNPLNLACQNSEMAFSFFDFLYHSAFMPNI